MDDIARRPRPGERREQILTVALRLFAERGVGNVTTRQIAQAVGISQPTLYAHFPSADAIADELCVRAFDTLHGRFATMLAAVADPSARLDVLGRAYIEFGLEHPDMYRIAFMPTHVETVQSSAVVGLAQSDLAQSDPGMVAGLRAFSALRDQIVQIRGVDDDEIGVIAQAIWATVHGLTSLLIGKPQFPWAERERLILAVLAMGRGYVDGQRVTGAG
ncbi:TetR/AcrR family transcriptional regulator [Novosphingobium sp.]|uniref:TetR/AcrR family transcriptional regulator n=1 Tax=Novosphingobium sp. TaxID=1874826 RepID=UPI00333FE7AA